MHKPGAAALQSFHRHLGVSPPCGWLSLLNLERAGFHFSSPPWAHWFSLSVGRKHVFPLLLGKIITTIVLKMELPRSWIFFLKFQLSICSKRMKTVLNIVLDDPFSPNTALQQGCYSSWGSFRVQREAWKLDSVACVQIPASVLT